MHKQHQVVPAVSAPFKHSAAMSTPTGKKGQASNNTAAMLRDFFPNAESITPKPKKQKTLDFAPVSAKPMATQMEAEAEVYKKAKEEAMVKTKDMEDTAS